MSRITVDDVAKAFQTQNERGLPEETAVYLDYDEASVIKMVRAMGWPEPRVFAGAIGIGIEIERTIQKQAEQARAGQNVEGTQ